MATGRIGVTPTLRTRWSKQPSAGTTSLSGLDDNSVSLVYDVGYEAVYRNGVLLSRGNDYTATSGTSITLIDATLAGDVIEVLANQLVPLTDAISKGQFTAKGALLSATAASTPGVITVGANDTVLTADSSTATGLKWAAPAAGGMTSLASGSIAAATTGIDISSIPNTYNELVLYITNASTAAVANIAIRVNNNSSADYSRMYISQLSSSVNNTSGATSLLYVDNFDATQAGQTAVIKFPNYKNTTAWKLVQASASYTNEYTFMTQGLIKATAAIDRIQIISSSTFDGGTYELFGVK